MNSQDLTELDTSEAYTEGIVSYDQQPDLLKPHKKQQPPKAQKAQDSSNSLTERISFKPLRYRLMNLEYMEPKEPQIKRRTGSRCSVTSDWEDLRSIPKYRFLKELLRPLHGKKTVRDLDFEFPKDQCLNDVISMDMMKELGHYSSLQKLRIHYARSGSMLTMTKQHYVNLANGLKRVPHLKELHVKTEKGQVEHEGMKFLGKAVKRLGHLEKVTFEFEENYWNPEQRLIDLSRSLRRHVSLKTVNLRWIRDSRINEKAVGYLGKSMEKYINVENFCLLFNRCEKIGDLSIEAVNSGLKNMKNLKSVQVSWRGCDKISDAGVERFLEGLENHEKLEKVWVNFRGCDRISAAGIQSLGERLIQLKALKKLTLKFRGVDKITDEGLTGLLKGIEALKDLEEISLNLGSCRKITAEGFKELWQGLRGIASLKNVYLGVKGCSKNLVESDIMDMLEDARKIGKELIVVAEKTHIGTYANSKSPLVYKS